LVILKWFISKYPHRFIAEHKDIVVLTSIFVLAVIFHFGPLLLSLQAKLYGGPGDHTSGLIWLYDQYSKTPWWQFSHSSAYPWGEKVWDPVFIIGQVQYIPHWILSKLVGPVAGYNLLVLCGVGLSYLITALFVYTRIVKKSILAALTGYFIAFSPMTLGLLIIGHTSFVFGGAYVVGTIWLIFNIFDGVRVRASTLLLGVILGSLFYFDPYFVLIVVVSSTMAVIALTISSALDIGGSRRPGQLKDIARAMAFVTTSVLVAVTPLVFFLHTHPSPGLGGRSAINITTDAYQYGARVSDYILPSTTNYLFPGWLRRLKEHSFHGASPSYTLFLGYSFMVTVIVTWCALLVVMARRGYGAIKAAQEFRYFFVFLIISVVAFYFSLPALYRIGGIRVITPADIITHITYTWRLFSTFDILVWPSLIISTLAGARIIYRLTKYKHSVIIASGVIITMSILELSPFTPLDYVHIFDYRTSLPQTYTEIRDTSSIRVIAEYPIREQPYYHGSLYLTAQHFHTKKTFNADTVGNSTTGYREAVMDLGSPQTLPLLRAFGVDAIHVHHLIGSQQSDTGLLLPVIGATSYRGIFGMDNIRLYTLFQQPKYRYLLKLNRNSRPINEDQLTGIEYPVSDHSQLELIDLCQLEIPVMLQCSRLDPRPSSIEFDVHSPTNGAQPIRLLIGGRIVYDATVKDGDHVSAPDTGAPGLISFELDKKNQLGFAISNFYAKQPYVE
jgi:hypothetical protein